MQNIKRFLSLALALVLVLGMVPATVFAAEATPALPTATVSKITQEDLTFAMNFKVDSITEEQLNHYGSWYADFELTVNTDVVFNNDGSADGWLAGQYDAWSENWVTVPFGKYAPVTVKANEPLKIMAFAAELMDEPGLKYTYKEVYESVKDFDCGVFFDNEFLAANPDLEVKLELKMYNPENESENYVIGETYIYNNPIIAKNTTTNEVYSGVTEAMMAAKEGETVILLKDATEAMVSVFAGATLDLNGNALAANYVSCFGDIIDSSADNSGLLAVSADRMMIREDNAQMPVHNGNGYKFAEVLKIATAMASEYKFAFQPRFEPGMLELLKQGTATTGVTIQVQVSWKQGNGERTQKFVYNDSHVQEYLNSYNASTDKYGNMFTLTLNGAANFEELTFTALAVSNTKVNVSSDDLRPQKPAGNVTTDANNQVVNDVTIGSGNASALVPSGTQLESGTNNVTLNTTVIEGNESNANITLGEGEQMVSMDVHVEGVAANNTKPIIVTLTNLAIEGLNEGNIALYHVENGETVAMTRVYSIDEVDAHNEYYYDIATGTITMALATFSEVALVSVEGNPWNGNYNYEWYDASKDSFEIYNADQLAGLSAIVGGMDGQTQDSFAGETITLMADIDLNDVEGDGKIFYPIGYWNNTLSYNKASGKVTVDGVETAVSSGFYTFEGTFDGNGHTIKNFYQNTWEMFGDYNDGYSGTPNHYRDGMGLFGKVYGGTVKNLTIEKFTSDGEFTTTGCIAAYADCGATFENIAITNCNPRVYNIGNGGIVGCVGWYGKETSENPVTFRNITVDNSNKISALWGSWDVACGGIVGQYYPTSGQSSANYPVNAGIRFENCHVAAQMDVYNDVCANYQYYAYRYAGMLIGSVRENVTIDGHSYPKMDGITASGCTVHFGDWNDYYYCELVANSLASYTHDHQMSRLTQVQSVDIANKTVTDLDGNTTAIPTSGRVNYVVVTAKDANGMWIHGDGANYATCYHFVNGVQHFHDVADTDNPEIYETVDGKQTLKEDKQLIYREFNQLFTGYGWGVTSKGITDFAGVENMDIQLSDNEKSVEKFEKADTAKDAYTTETTVTINELFRAVADLDVAIDTDNVQVFVSPANETSTAGGTYTANTEDWTQGTLTLSGTGAAYITITDYYYCTPTTVTVNVTERQPGVKFETKFTGDFLYRVGNQNAVSLDSLFKEKDGVTIGTVAVTVENVDDSNVTWKYTSNATWTSGTIQFSGTGVVKVTIKDDDAYCEPTVLYLEVVDAVNATAATSATSNNVVLLNDISSSGITVSNGYAFYGNGFKVTCSGKGTYLNYGGMYRGYVNVESGGLLDNVQVFCDIYPVSLLYASEAADYKDEAASEEGKTRNMYQLSAVAISGEGSMITNSYVYGGRNNIYVGDGNVCIENTTTENGTLANIQIKSSDATTVTLKDITTIQNEVVSTYDANKTMLGAGILVGDVTSVSNPYVIIQGTWNHYNWVTATNATNTSNTYAKEIITNALTQTNYIHQNASGADTVNLGLIVLNTLSSNIDDQRSVASNYLLSNVTMTLKDPDTGISGNVNGQVYSIAAGNGNPDAVAPEYVPTKNMEYKPYASKDETVDGQYDPTIGENDFSQCYWNDDVLQLMYREGDNAFSLPVAELVGFNKFGYNLVVSSVSVTKNGTVVTAVDDKVTFTDAGTYVITYTVTDPYNYDKDGKAVASAKEWTFTYDAEVYVIKAGKTAEIVVNSTSFYGDYGKDTSTGFWDPDYHYCIPFMEGVTITDYAEDGVTASTFDATKNIISITTEGDKTSGTITLTYLDGRVLVVKTSGHSVGLGSSGNTISVKSYDGQLWICTDGVSNNATTGTWTVSSYKFTGNNGVPVEYTTARTCNFDSSSTTNSPQTTWGDFGSVAVDSIKYTVTYNANGGTCTKTFSYATTSSPTVTLPTPIKPGMLFAGWFDAAEGGNKIGDAGASYAPSANITLYAQWRLPCTVTYTPNGGSCDVESQKYTGTDLILPNATNGDKIFMGWYTEASGGERIGGAGDTYTPEEDIELFAQWSDPITVTYDPNGGTCGTSSEIYDGDLILPTPSKTGHTFTGWYTAASGGTKIGDAGAPYVPSANITLYAQWKKIPYTITVSTTNATVSGVTNGQTAYYGDTITFTVTFDKDKSQTVTVKDASENTITTTGTYTFTMPDSNVTISASSSGCFAEGTLITLADGTQKPIEQITYTDELLAWDFNTGAYVVTTPSLIEAHEAGEYRVINLRFADGTVVRVIVDHGFFDVEENNFVYIDEENVDSYIGHDFVKMSENGTYESVKLIGYEVTVEVVSYYTIQTAIYNNCIAENMFTLTSPPDMLENDGWFDYFEIGEGMKYDEEKKQADIEKYGLYTYEDFAEYVTYEQFIAFNGPYLKVLVGKGVVTYEQIIELIGTYVK